MLLLVVQQPDNGPGHDRVAAGCGRMDARHRACRLARLL